MLERLIIENLGPAPKIDFEFAPRLNLITGDNGLGKTFTLDLAWYALTRTWADGRKVLPNPSQPMGSPVLHYHVHGKGGPNQEVEVKFDSSLQDWISPRRRPPMPGLVVYARLDGGFSVWDPARNYWRPPAAEEVVEAPTEGQRERPSSFEFTKKQVWDGLKIDGRTICNGLISDVDKWRLSGNGPFDLLQKALARLSPGDGPPLRITGSARVSVDDVRDVPTLDLGYAEVPITQSSAGIRRVLSLAYLLVWAWTEHAMAAKLRREDATEQIVLLFDEIEAHLHPQWQRVFLPALKELLETTIAGRAMRVQVIATTHAPLVLASAEPFFEEPKDRLFTFDVLPPTDGAGKPTVAMTQLPWAKMGDAVEWLTSDVFDLKQGYSRDAERVIEASQAFMRGDTGSLPPDLQTVEQIDAEIGKVLGGDDTNRLTWFLYRQEAIHDQGPVSNS